MQRASNCCCEISFVYSGLQRRVFGHKTMLPAAVLHLVKQDLLKPTTLSVP